MAEETINVFCPVCSGYGRQKLLFQKDKESKGTIRIRCRGCRETITVNLDKEPVSRSSK